MLETHRFVVLTGPPEMGKTAIARMIALAQLTCRLGGARVHEPGGASGERTIPGRAQVFIADDAFGSTEYRADAAERWARAIERPLALARRPPLADLDLPPGAAAAQHSAVCTANVGPSGSRLRAACWSTRAIWTRWRRR